MNYSGTLRITNPKTLQKWKYTNKYKLLIKAGYKYAEGCGRFRKEECNCRLCRLNKLKEETK